MKPIFQDFCRRRNLYLDHQAQNGTFKKYEVLVKFSNGDSIDASFKDKDNIQKFLKYLSS